MSQAKLTLALSKGRIFEETLPLLRAAGIEVLEDPEKSRKLILPTNRPAPFSVRPRTFQAASAGGDLRRRP